MMQNFGGAGGPGGFGGPGGEGEEDSDDEEGKNYFHKNRIKKSILLAKFK